MRWAAKPPGVRVLYVEDFIPYRERVMARCLAGHQVTLCDNVAEACAAFRRGAYDLVLLDYELPDGKGGDVAHFIRGTGDQVVIVANSSSGSCNQHLLALGATHAVLKSQEEELAVLLASLLHDR
ncbi:MAG: response regulator [Candidatus Xenobia bacterium]